MFFTDWSQKTLYASGLTDDESTVLAEISNQHISDLLARNHSQLLVFPFGTEDNIQKQSLFWIEKHENSMRVHTESLVGFFGKGDVDIHIGSRFDGDDEDTKHQYFLHYMVQKILHLNMLNWDTRTDREDIWDFLLYLFPVFLKRAMHQGMFRTYRTFSYNNPKVKGTIDIKTHINRNIPFRGDIAYQVREHTFNNALTHLIRHTIEAIRKHPRQDVRDLLSNDTETRKDVELILFATPDYSPHTLAKIVSMNLRPVRHPFYTEYIFLQRLCLQILRHEKLTYGKDDERVHGLIFDASWLWEEYLNTIMAPLSFVHLRRGKTKGIDYYDTSEGGEGYKGAFPDFLRKDETPEGVNLVADAKYQKIDEKDKDELRGNRFQLISYLHILHSHAGILIYPRKAQATEPYSVQGRKLNGYGGYLGMLGMSIPQHCESYSEFCQKIGENERALAEWLSNPKNHSMCSGIL